jgi:hypothetical protein
VRKQLKFLPFLLGLLLTPGLPFPNCFSTSIAAEITFAWNPNSESDLDGYSVYQSIGSKGPPYELIGELYLDELADPDNPEVTLTQLQEDVNYYFVVTAYDKAGNESQFSNEICLKIEDSSIIDCAPAIASGGGGGGSNSG